ncbi:peroxide stress protein YaaA [Parvularcula maris]|uniref:UPF0246 protein NOG11_08165 n=1 Tax=Parvularcula maris TaxID=2965077 RepID=A0A9X2L9C9_9PROT|nr:peroxide stress protein YaaA [Parvularcula maris]MCQ8185366.1 peroxide stress protein YaaA [Parvularcula maris]
MLIVLSPAKNLDFEPADGRLKATEPRFMDQTEKLAGVLKKKSAGQIGQLMGLSEKLSSLNAERYKAFGEQSKKQAILAFNGDVYRGFDAGTLDAEGLHTAQERVRILSGLYGVLRPLDAIEPYRLEMGTKLKVGHGESLYDFWGSRLSESLDKELGGKPLVNCASNEYFKAAKGLKAPVVTCQFKEEKDEQLKTLGLFAKVARGQIARFAVDERLDHPEGLKDFRGGGYRFQPKLSDEKRYVFTRPQPAKKG